MEGTSDGHAVHIGRGRHTRDTKDPTLLCTASGPLSHSTPHPKGFLAPSPRLPILIDGSMKVEVEEVSKPPEMGGGGGGGGGGGEGGQRLSIPSSTANRFLTVLDPHPNDRLSHDFLELDERDVVWSPLPSESDASLPSPSVIRSPVSPFPARGASYQRRHPQQRPFDMGRSGLSAALAEGPRGFVQQRKPGVDPSISAARAVPVLLRSGSGLEASGVRSETGRLWHMSAPVNVPVWGQREKKGFHGRGGRYGLHELGTNGVAEEEEEEEEEKEVEMVPPHVMVARSQVTTFSVFEGVGRTLKGRDLRRVRNAVLQQTGFLD